MKLSIEKSVSGRVGCSLPVCDVPEVNLAGLPLRAQAPDLPQLSEPEVVRHYTALSRLNFGVDSGLYPLGSCTMKYNPKLNEALAALDGFAGVHPAVDPSLSRGCLTLMADLQRQLCAITGMDAFTLQPAAGAHGEMTGMMMIAAYHRARNDDKRKTVLIPDTAHGTNPASAALCGFDCVEIKSDQQGNVDLDDLKAHLDDSVAALMLTNPSTLGLFEPNIMQIAELVHASGGLLYYDGANANAIVGITRPGDMGFDVIHLNLHKTFSTPHGGGGPGAGPVGVKAALAPFLPVPVITNDATLDTDRPQSIGRVRSYYGNFGVLVRAYAYLLSMGGDGLTQVARDAVLNANYLMARLSDKLKIAYPRRCMHEFVATALPQKDKGVSALDLAKRMIDFSVHPPTIYFPLIVREAMMFEPTETESKQTLDQFVETMTTILNEAETSPETPHTAPHTTVVGRLDDTRAARKPVLTWRANP